MVTSAETEAFYRFLDNKRVTPAQILAPHAARTLKRLGESDTVLVIHDSTEVYPASADADGGFAKMSHGYGYLAHVSLAVSANGFIPQGLLKMTVPEPLDESTRTQDWRERWHAADKLSRRWLDHALAIDELFEERAVIHVMDREGDSYEILHDLHQADSLFVIRLSYDRRIGDGNVVSDVLESATHRATREVPLGVRKPRRGRGKTRRPAAEKRHPSRKARKAKLELRAVRDVTIQRPHDLPSAMQGELSLNVVHVIEPKPPGGEAAVEWRLITSLPVDTAEEVERIVDIYRRRWLIEELFKALKTGCGLNHRLPQSLHTAANGFAILVLFAWHLLLLRQLERTAPTAPAKDVLTSDALAHLRQMMPRSDKLPSNARARHIIAAFARLGGHNKSNGPPGWQVLGRGYFRFLASYEASPWVAWIDAPKGAEW
jgi:hypothetical protein